MKLNFKNWIENQVLGGGLEPPKQQPIDPTPGKGQSKGAMPDYHQKCSDELPPTKKCKKRQSQSSSSSSSSQL